MDEAFALLVLENNWDLWIALATEVDPDSALYPQAKYTCDAKKGGKGKGWTLEGKIRFIELCALVSADHSSEGAGLFEDTFLAARKVDKESLDGRKNRRGKKPVLLTTGVDEANFATYVDGE